MSFIIYFKLYLEHANTIADLIPSVQKYHGHSGSASASNTALGNARRREASSTVSVTESGATATLTTPPGYPIIQAANQVCVEKSIRVYDTTISKWLTKSMAYSAYNFQVNSSNQFVFHLDRDTDVLDLYYSYYPLASVYQAETNLEKFLTHLYFHASSGVLERDRFLSKTPYLYVDPSERDLITGPRRAVIGNHEGTYISSATLNDGSEAAVRMVLADLIDKGYLLAINLTSGLEVTSTVMRDASGF